MDDSNSQTARRSSLRSVVAATDFSPAADDALSWAMTVARRHGARLHLVHAVSRTLPLLSRHNEISPLAEASVSDASRRLEELAASIRSVDQMVESHLLYNRPSVSILKVAHWERAGLVVLGTRGLGGVHQLMLGSTAERVAESAACPVLTVGPAARPASDLRQRILIATDFSIEADAAAITVQEICRVAGRPAEILLLSVLHPPAGLESDVALRRLWWEYVGECRGLLDERLALISRTFGPEISSARALLREGVPATEIVRVANQEEVDMIAMGSRGSFAAGRGFLGSVSKRVVQTARSPVLTVPSLLSKRMRNKVRQV